MKLGHILLVCISGALALAGCGEARVPTLTAEQECHVGAYRFADGRVVDVAPADGENLRWRMEDGRTGRLSAANGWRSTRGWTDESDGVSIHFRGCADGRLAFAGGDGESVEARKVAMVVREATFDSGGVQLFGRLVLPEGDQPVPIVVQVHGSERDAATVFNFRQRLYPAKGVGVFVFDKRGTGRSDGKYTQDFQALASDVAEAVKTARRLAGNRAARVGLEGGSQGGWISPLAAGLTPVDFVIVGYGLADTPQAENRDEALQDVVAAGFDSPDVRRKALEVIAASDAVMTSRFRSGYDRVNEVKRKYGKEPWFEHVRGEYTGELMKYPSWALRVVGPLRDVGTPWTYDPMPALRSLNAPLLWVLAGDDSSAPVDITRRRLLDLAREGRPVTVIEFPGTEHGILEFVTDESGKRLETRYAEGYFRSSLDWARDGRLEGAYGAAKVLTAGAGSPNGEMSQPEP